jgi:hypothetical protein
LARLVLVCPSSKSIGAQQNDGEFGHHAVDWSELLVAEKRYDG